MCSGMNSFSLTKDARLCTGAISTDQPAVTKLVQLTVSTASSLDGLLGTNAHYFDADQAAMVLALKNLSCSICEAGEKQKTQKLCSHLSAREHQERSNAS